MTLNATKNIITKSLMQRNWNTAYGNIWIDPNEKSVSEYRWDIKLYRKHFVDFYINIGIDASDKKFTDKNFGFGFTDTDSMYYSYRTDGYIESGNRNGSLLSTVTIAQWGQQCERKDIVTMILNVKNGTLTFCRNNQDMGIAHNNIC